MTPTWKNVTHRAPCSVCKSPGWCSVSSDGQFALCRKVHEGARQRVDKHGVVYSIHRLREGPVTALQAPPTAQSAPDSHFVDKAYSAFLDCPAAALSPRHLHELEARGMSARTIRASRCCSLPPDTPGRRAILQAMARAVGTCNLGKVPGVVIEHGRPRIYAGPGLVIPTTNFATGELTALHIRFDVQRAGRKYGWLSSGPAGGAKPRLGPFVAFPEGQAGPWATARVTEGELKALVAAQCSGLLTVSVPGVDLWSLAIPALRGLGVKRVQVAFDNDWHTNDRVEAALRAAEEGFKKAGFAVTVETWPLAFKGVDDFLIGQAPKKPTRVQAALAVFAPLQTNGGN